VKKTIIGNITWLRDFRNSNSSPGKASNSRKPSLGMTGLSFPSRGCFLLNWPGVVRHLANSDRLSWKYVIKDGVVWEVSNKAEVASILKPGKKLK